MTRILGLDLGTNSIGWALIDHERHFSPTNNRQDDYKFATDENEQPLGGVVIFQEGVKIEKGNESSKAAERTGYRSTRRLKFRRKLRKYETLKALQELKLCPIGKDELERWRSHKNTRTGKSENFKHYPTSQRFLHWLHTDNQASEAERKKQHKNPYFFRDLASRQKLDMSDEQQRHQLGRAFYHMAQRRGFLSNRLDVADTSIIEEHQPRLAEIIEEAERPIDLTTELQAYFNEQNFDKKDEREKLMTSLFNAFERIWKNNEKDNGDLKALQEKLRQRLFRKENLGAVKQGIMDLSAKIDEAECQTLGQYFYQAYQKNEKIRSQYTAREGHYLAEFHRICQMQGLLKTDIEKLERAIFYQRPLRSQKGLVGKCKMEPSKPRCASSHPDFEEYRMLQQINNIKYKNEDGKWASLSEAERQKIRPKYLRKSKEHFDFEDIIKVLGEERHYNYKPNMTMTGCPTTANLIAIFGDDWKVELKKSWIAKPDKAENLKTADEVAHDVWHALATFDKTEKLEEFGKTRLGLSEKRAKKFAAIRLKKDFARLSLSAIRKILKGLRAGQIYSYAVMAANLEKIVDEDKWADPAVRKTINEAIREEINHNTETNRIHLIVNELLKKQRDENAKFSEEAKEQFEEDILAKLKSHFGKNKWENMEESDEIQREVSRLFFRQFQKNAGQGEFLPVPRLDEKVKQFLKDNEFCTDHRKLTNLYHPSDIETYPEAETDKHGDLQLGSPMTSAIKNPMAMRTLHQLRKLVNSLLKAGHIDRHTRIHIELARDLNDSNKRKAIQRYQRERQKEHEDFTKEIAGYFQKKGKQVPAPITETDVLKYRLWKEQGMRCLYTGDQIGVSDFIGADPKYDIEHTIPRSRGSDNSQMNKTLCQNKYNREVKKNKIPTELTSDHEKIMSLIGNLGWEQKINDLDERIKMLIRATKNATTKEAKDQKIQYRHYLSLHRDYWKGKFLRFKMKDVPEGFKNSQLVDTGIITKYARAYLKSAFKRVDSVKGSTVAEFRKAWGLQDEHGQKSRDSHFHHCMDAFTIACMTKEKYDVLAHAWRQEEEGRAQAYRKIKENSKPWPTFKQDVQNIENQIFVSHHNPDKVKKQVRKYLRKRGKIQYDEKTGRPKIQQGDTVRGSLHLDTGYGAIKRKDADGNDKLFYTIRRDLESLKKSEVDCIADEGVRQKIEAAIESGELAITTNDLQKNKVGHVWMKEPDEESGFPGIPIKKVKVLAKAGRGFLTSAIPLRTHRDLSKHEHKRNFYVKNEENYILAIYEGQDKKGKLQRKCEIANMLDAGQYFKLSNREHRANHPLVPESKNDLPLRTIVTKGTLVLFWEESPQELRQCSKLELTKRLYKIVGFDDRPRVMFQHHMVADSYDQKRSVSKVDFDQPAKDLNLGAGNLDMLVEGADFWMNKMGQLTFSPPSIVIENRVWR